MNYGVLEFLVMFAPTRQLLLFVLVSFLWTTTLLHDFVEDVVVSAEGSEIGHSHLFVVQSRAEAECYNLRFEEHAHHPSLSSNHRGAASLAGESTLPTTFSPNFVTTWISEQPVVLNLRQRPPPRAQAPPELPIYLRIQALLI